MTPQDIFIACVIVCCYVFTFVVFRMCKDIADRKRVNSMLKGRKDKPNHYRRNK